MNVIFNLDKMYKVMIAIISINNIYEENMKKIIALLVCFVALIPVTVFANEYNYSDNYVSIIFTDDVYSTTKRADYTTHYGIRSKTAFAQVKANGKSKTKSGYQAAHAKMTGVKIDNNHQHIYWYE